MIFTVFHYLISKFSLKLLQNLTFFGPDFVSQCFPLIFWVRYIQNHMPKHSRGQNLAPIGAFRLYDTFKALKLAKNAEKRQKTLFPPTLRVQISQKSQTNQLFLYESLFPYILAICAWIFRPKF